MEPEVVASLSFLPALWPESFGWLILCVLPKLVVNHSVQTQPSTLRKLLMMGSRRGDPFKIHKA